MFRTTKNLVFYVAIRSIQKGEELLIDYGEDYYPMPPLLQEELGLGSD
jgi:hypothetical protein